MKTLPIATVLLISAAAWAQSDNLLTNESFEHRDGEAPADWLFSALKGAPNHSTWKTAALPRSGARAAVLRLDKRDTWVLIDQRVEPGFAKGDQYVFRVWLKAQQPVETSISLLAQCPSIGKVYDQNAACHVTEQWQRFEVPVTISPVVGDPTRISRLPGSAGEFLRAIVQVRVPQVDVYIDDAQLVRVKQGSESLKPASPTAAEPPPVEPPQEDEAVNVIMELPEKWLFRKDRKKVGEEQRWFMPGDKQDPWQPLTTHNFWPDHIGDGWYAVDATIPSAVEDKVWLVFGAVDENHTVWLNGEYLGDNLGEQPELIWDKPAAYNITGRYKQGESNHIVVRVHNSAGGGGIWKPSYIVTGASGRYPTEAIPVAPPDARWLQPGDDVVTPHIKWDKPSAAGPLRVLFITYRLGMREIVEVCQRFDIDREVFALELPIRFGGGVESGQHVAFPSTFPEDQVRRLREKLALDYDCIAIGNVPWAQLPDWSRQMILKKVAGGTGLVACLNGAPGDDLKAAMTTPLEEDWSAALGAYPFRGLPVFAKHGTAKDFYEATLKSAQHDKGRIVLLGGYKCPTFQAFAPGITKPFTDYHMVHYDYYLALVGRVMQWSARGAPPIAVKAPNRPDEPGIVTFVTQARTAAPVTVSFALRHSTRDDVMQELSKSVDLPKGDHDLQFKLPGAPAGSYFADLWVKREGKTVASASQLVHITGKHRLKTITLDSDDQVIRNFSVHDSITGTVDLTAPSQGLRVQITQTDNHGRLMASEVYPANQSSVRFTLRQRPVLSVLQWIDVRLLDGDVVLDHQRTSFTYNDMYLPDPGKEFRYVIWEGYLGETYLNDAVHRQLGAAGFEVVWSQFNFDPQLRSAGAVMRNNLYEMPSLHYPSPVRPRIWGDPIPVKPGSAEHIRKPCLTDPAIQRITADTYRKAAVTAGKYSSTQFHLGSETEFTSRTPGREVCFSPTCIAYFHKHLERTYGSIAALNKQYGSDHERFEDVDPIDFKTAIKTDQFPLWVDFRRAMDSVWADYHARATETITQVVPAAAVGTEAANDPGHQPTDIPGIGGDDWWKLARAQTYDVPYFYPPQLDVLRDFADPTTINGPTYGGYVGVFRMDRVGRWHQWLMWHSLLRYRSNCMFIWQGTGSSRGDITGATIAPDLTWYPFMKESNHAAKQMRTGIGRLVLAMDRPDDGAAVLYSQPSMYAANLHREMPQRWDSLAAVSMTLPSAGLQYRYITPEQLGDGALQDGGYRLLYLPYCQAMSPRQAKRVRTFVRDGGTVLADLRPAVVDAHCKRYERGALDDVFGIRQDTRMARPVIGRVEVSQPDMVLPMATADASLQLAGARANATVAGAPAVIVNEFGAGRAILLNVAVSDYVLDKLMDSGHTALRFVDNDTAENLATLLRGLTSHTRPPSKPKVTPQVPGVHLYRYTSGETQLLGLQYDIVPYLPGVGSRSRKRMNDIAEKKTHDVTITLDNDRHIYNVFAGKYMGQSGSITHTIKPGDIKLMTALPYKVDALRADVDVVEDRIEYKVTVVPSQHSQLNLHMLRLQVTRPDGQPAPHYAANVDAPGGVGRGALHMAINDPRGTWQLTWRDVVSGTSITQAVKYRP